jgi:hypothetical protein
MLRQTCDADLSCVPTERHAKPCRSGQKVGICVALAFVVLACAASSASAASGPPAVEDVAVKAVTGTEAEVTAEVNPDGSETEVYGEYGIAEQTDYGRYPYEYGSNTEPTDIGAGPGVRRFGATLKGLQAGDTYYFRLVAANAQGEVKGTPVSVIMPTAGTPGWEIHAQPIPTHMIPGRTGRIEVEVYNTGGDASAAGATVSDALPEGLTAVSQKEWTCSGGKPVVCSEPLGAVAAGIQTQSAAYYEQITPTVAYETTWLDVDVEGGASGTGVNHVTVSGGGAAASASFTGPVTFSATPAGFGVAGFDGWFSNANGTPDTQAGSHPFEATTRLDLNTRNEPEAEEEGRIQPEVAGGEVRGVEAVLPPGFVGDPQAAPQCTHTQFDRQQCPAATQIGVNVVGFGNFNPISVPVYNLVPPSGVPAQFGFLILGVQSYLDAEIRSGGDYGITEHIDDIPQKAIESSSLTLWGVPGEESHNAERRGPGCEYGCASGAQLLPLLTLPTSCEGPLTTTVRVNAWENSSTGEASYESRDESGAPLGITGCGSLSFGPAMSIAPDTSYADTPAGLSVEIRVPQEAVLDPEGVSTADIKDTEVVLPEGVVINPGQAAGLAACQASQDGLGRLPDGEENNGPASCPPAAKVGTDEIETPLLKGKLQGSVYVLQSNPPDLKLLITAYGEGVFLKLVGNVQLNEATGQLTTTFDETPALPYSDFKLSFNGGAQAALDTPTQCGTYATSADFTPWATPSLPDWLESSDFEITSGPGSGSCSSSPLPFSPSLVAGSTTDQAGGFTSFSLLLQRGDGQQRIDKLSFKAPEGLTGFLSKVPLCTNAQAESNECPPASKIGHTVVESGPGPYPLVVPEPDQEPAPIYLTDGYQGGPFGLSIVVPLHVGPFTLPTQLVRGKIEVNPLTAALTVTTDPLPQVVAGVPTDLREVDAVIERPEFMVNPTNCDAQEFTGTAYGTPPAGEGGAGAEAPISSHFQVGSCRSLEFAPKLSVSTSANTSKADGASLTTKVSYPNVPQGVDADIASVKVELPKQLPSRLSTLQKACTSAQFEANPADCPAASKIGYAVVHTPLLPVPLEGPAIFVSHGGEAFPSLTMILQGDGVTIDLVGTTFISKAGVTSTTFKAVPDAPFSTFELTLPEGPYSALTANANLCSSDLVLPDEFVGQNGAKLDGDTHIAVEDCPNDLRVVSKTLKGRTVTLRVSVPGAGKLTAAGSGLSAGSKSSGDREVVTLKLGARLTAAQRATLKRHPGRKIVTTLKLRFIPKQGKPLTKAVSLNL